MTAPTIPSATPPAAAPAASTTRRRARSMLVGVALGCAIVAALWVSRRETPPPEDLGALPAWSLTDQDDKPIGTQQLAGTPYATSFFFTSCPSTCPKIMGAMKTLQDRTTGTPLRLISITVDPETDTPKHLSETAGRYGVDPTRWRLATGSVAQIKTVIVDGFRTYVGKKVAKSDDVYDIAHGARLVLVDAKGQVRGHFSTDDAGVTALIAAFEAL